MKKYMAIAGLVLVTVIWGGGFVASDMALDSLSPFQIMTIRFLLASVLMGGISIRNLKGIKKEEVMLGGRKTVICEFLGTGMISVMPVPLLSVHPREYSQQGHIRYVPSVCVYRWTCPVPPHKPPLQAL